MKEFVLFLWQLPQNLVGILVALFTRSKEVEGYYRWKYWSGLSLGNYMFVNKSASEYTKAHEKGHQKQSLYLGWLYLVVIGLPSLIWCCLHGTVIKNKSYYWFYTEKWANKIAGLKDR